MPPSRNESLLRHPFIFYVRRHPGALAVGMGFLLITNILDGLWPLLLKEGVDLITAKAPFSEVGRVALTFFLIMGGLSATRYGWRMGFGRFHTLSAEDLRLRLFRHLSRLSPGFFLKRPIGELMSMVTNDVQTFRQGIGNGVLVFADGIIILCVVLPVMWSLNPSWTVRALIFLPAVPLLIWWVMKRIHVASKNQQEAFGRVTAHCQESVAGVRVVKGFALEDVRLASFNRESRDYEKACNTTARIDALFHPVMEFGVTAGTVIFLFVAREDLISGAASIGTFVAFHRYILKTVWPMTALGMGLSQLQKGFGAFDRIKEVMEQEPQLLNAGEAPLGGFESLELRGVSFRYPGTEAWILRDVNLHLRRGQSLGVAGPVGAGKTTLMALLTRQYDPTEGEILLNGRPLHDYPLEEIRRCFTLVPQDVFLFSETVTENIGFGFDEGFGDLEAQEAAKNVDIHEEIHRLPEGYASLVGEKGVNLSGGQKQRMALARGLVLRAEVLLLDDVLSAVDTRTEKKIESALRTQRAAGRTQVLIAHRLSTLESCDLLLVLNDGRVEAFGPREQALKDSTFLRRLESIQHEEGRP